VCCNILQRVCVKTHIFKDIGLVRVIQRIAQCCSVLHGVAVRYSECASRDIHIKETRVAVRCSVLQCVAVCASRDNHIKETRVGRCVHLRIQGCVLQCVAVRCSVLQCVAVCCSVLQCVAVCCKCVGDELHHTQSRRKTKRVRERERLCVKVEMTHIYKDRDN